MPQEPLNGFSLLYPSAESKALHLSGKGRPVADEFTLSELGIAEILPVKNRPLCDFLTRDHDVILYRQKIFADMLKNEQIGKTITKLVPVLCDILELRRLSSESEGSSEYLESMTEIELYISSINVLYEGLCKDAPTFESEAMTQLQTYVRELVESAYYAELNARLEELTARVREIRSVTIGVNLDAQLRPREAGVLSINPGTFRPGDTLHKIMRLNFKEDEYTCIADLVPFGKKQSENQKTALSLAFNSAIGDVYRRSLRSWRHVVQAYVLENTDFLLELLPEFEFLQKGTNLMRALSVKGNALCTPTLRSASERAFEATGLYNPTVALKIDESVVTNDLAFDENAAIYVLTGPNRGGKSVITCAVGAALVLAQLGLFVPATSATLSPADVIFTHFPTGADDTIDKGRLGEECARLSEILGAISAESLVLLDESLSSTGSFEASYIAAEVLAGLSRVGCRCIFSTHLHELAAEIDSINARTAPEGGAPIDTLVAGIEDAGKRSFRILRAKPDGKSYARDIAAKYGLTYDNIIQLIQDKQ